VIIVGILDEVTLNGGTKFSIALHKHSYFVLRSTGFRVIALLLYQNKDDDVSLSYLSMRLFRSVMRL
jgi:hypothetical protein